MKIAQGLAAAALLAGMVAGAQGATLDVVKKRGTVVCGTTTGFAGFSAPDKQGTWRGLDVDLCRAVAAAVFGDASKIKVVPLNSQQRFTALQSGEVDVLTRNTTVTQQRDTALGIIHAGINFYDGQGFMVPKSLGVKSAKELNGATICLREHAGRLGARQPGQLQAGGDRNLQRSGQCLCLGALRRVQHGCVGPGVDPHFAAREAR